MIKQPSSSNCFVCGRQNHCGLKLDFYFDENGDVISRKVLPDCYEGYPGIVHGGVIAAMLDEASGRAYSQDPNHFSVTSELKVRYRKPVPTNTTLIIKGYRVKQRGRVAIARGEILDEAGNLLAESEGVFVDIPEDMRQDVDPEAFGWKVYP